MSGVSLPHFAYTVIDGLVQERHITSALAMEICLSCTNPSIYTFDTKTWYIFNVYHNLNSVFLLSVWVCVEYEDDQERHVLQLCDVYAIDEDEDVAVGVRVMAPFLDKQLYAAVVLTMTGAQYQQCNSKVYDCNCDFLYWSALETLKWPPMTKAGTDKPVKQ